MLVDSHCHLNFNSFDPDRQFVIERAVVGGVTRILNPGIDLPTSHAAVKLAEEFEPVFAAVGIHPNDALSWNDTSLDELQALANCPKVSAIGEIGLDYYWEKTPHALQQEIFLRQLELADQLALPVVVHVRCASDADRTAMQDTIRILSKWTDHLKACNHPICARPGVLHSFSGDLGEAELAMQMNFYIGITGPVTFRKAVGLREVVARTPLERLLIETDAPFLTPVPHRGQRNEPAYVGYVANEIAILKNLSKDDVATRTTQNSGRLFLW